MTDVTDELRPSEGALPLGNSAGGEVEPIEKDSAPEARIGASGVVVYELDWNEFWRAQEICWRAATGKLFLRLVPATGLVAVTTGFVLVTLGGGAQLAPFFWLFGAAFLSTRLVRYWTVRRLFRRRTAGTRVEVEWGREGLRAVEAGATEKRIAWEDARVALLTSAGFLVEPRQGSGIWLPFSGFPNPDDVDRFEAEIREREVPLLDRSSVG